MGLFDRFKSSDEVVSTGSSAGRANYSNMKVEVMAPNGVLLFLATMMYHKGSTAELHQTSADELSPDIKRLRVHIRGFHEGTKKAVYMDGIILPINRRKWKVEDLRVVKMDNDRATFRLETYLPASAIRASGASTGPKNCKVLNISVGGARVSTEQFYRKDDRFYLRVTLPESQEESTILCQVKRVFKKDPPTYEYGCQFVQLTPADEEKISQSIFALQRKLRAVSR